MAIYMVYIKYLFTVFANFNKEALQMYLDEIQDWIAITHEALLSMTALHMLLADAGFSYKCLCKAAAECDDEAQEAWRRYVQENLVASMMVTAGEIYL